MNEYILDKANIYVGHEEDIDEDFYVTQERTAYAKGFSDALKKIAKVCSEINGKEITEEGLILTLKKYGE